VATDYIPDNFRMLLRVRLKEWILVSLICRGYKVLSVYLERQRETETEQTANFTGANGPIPLVSNERKTREKNRTELEK